MSLNNLQPAKGSVKHSKRVGRGAGSGKGGTATRGNKGAKSRSGYHQKIGFEGGQMPIYRRLPKFGFKNINRIEYVGINIDVLNTLAETKNITDFNVFNCFQTIDGKNLCACYKASWITYLPGIFKCIIKHTSSNILFIFTF